MNIAITGEGIICAIGTDKASVLSALRSKETGIATMRYLPSTHHELPVGEVKMSDDEMKSQLGIDLSQEISRTALMGMIAVRQALSDAQVSGSKGERIVFISGTTVAGMDVTERHFTEMRTSDDHLSCLHYHSCGDNTRQIAEHFGCFSEYTTVSTACSSAANALILGAEMLKAGEADIVVAGGTEALSVFHLNGFNSLMILDKDHCRPFDETREGLNLGEGAAYVVLESAEHARSRQASVHAFLRGYGNACDAFHQTASSENGEGAYLAMQEALNMAGLKPKDIDYVNAHGTGTPNNDLSESVALQRVFGSELPPVSSTKGFTGHTTSASGSIEVVICLLAMHIGQCFRQQVCNVPPFPERVRCLEPLFQRDTLNPFHNDAVADTFYRFKREDGNNHRVLHLTENIVLFLKECLINSLVAIVFLQSFQQPPPSIALCLHQQTISSAWHYRKIRELA